MDLDVQIFRYHVDCITKRVIVEFRVKNPETGNYEPPVGYGRHALPLNVDVLAKQLDADILPFLLRDLGELPIPVLRTHALTSELHQLREAREEKAEALRDASEGRALVLKQGREIDRMRETVRDHEDLVSKLSSEALRIRGEIERLQKQADERRSRPVDGRNE